MQAAAHRALARFALIDDAEHTVVIVEAAHIDEALARANAVLHALPDPPPQGSIFRVRRLEHGEPARAPFFSEGYFRLLGESLTHTRH